MNPINWFLFGGNHRFWEASVSKRLACFGLIGSLLVVLLLVGCSGKDKDKEITPQVGAFGAPLSTSGAQDFKVTLAIVEEHSKVIRAVAIFCAYAPTRPVIVGSDIPIKDGKFRVETSEMIIEGQFVSPSRAEGTVKTLIDLSNCGISNSATWVSECNLDLAEYKPTEPTEESSMLVNSYVITDREGRIESLGLLDASFENWGNGQCGGKPPATPEATEEVTEQAGQN
jgi:hypothetical protein